jgi:hypothetical protein
MMTGDGLSYYLFRPGDQPLILTARDRPCLTPTTKEDSIALVIDDPIVSDDRYPCVQIIQLLWHGHLCWIETIFLHVVKSQQFT